MTYTKISPSDGFVIDRGRILPEDDSPHTRCSQGICVDQAVVSRVPLVLYAVCSAEY